MKNIIRLVNQASKIKRQRKVISDLMKELEDKKRYIDFLFGEISSRDQKIAELIQQKGSKNPDPLNFEFPGTEKQFDDFWTKFYCPK